MKFTYETINILLLLIPGLISTRILSWISRSESKHKVNLAIDVLIYSFLVYAIVSSVYEWKPLVSLTKIGEQITYSATTDLKLLALTFVLAVLLPIFAGAILHFDLHMRALRFLKVTNRTSRETAWDDVFTNADRYITVHLHDGRRLTGWPMYYSNSPDEGFVYLYNPAWINEENEYEETLVHGTLINKENIDFIEFLKKDNERNGIEHESED